jgi:ABC-2 type transport system ATP-binding protein
MTSFGLSTALQLQDNQACEKQGEHMNALEMASLRKNYQSVQAVCNLNLSVPEGSIFGFLGPNGAGKTTTLRMIAGLVRPTSGEIRIFGQPVSFGKSDGRESIGCLPDVPNFYPWMKPQEYLMFSGKLYGIPHRQLKLQVSEVLETVGLTKAKRSIGGYSRGMKQRLGIAQALLHKPKLVLLDEPASALDPIGRKEVMEIIKSLAGSTTVFFSTHILTDIERVCDRVAIMNHGILVAEDDMDGLKRKYALNEWRIRVESNLQAMMLADVLQREPWSERVRIEDGADVMVTVNDHQPGSYRIPRIVSDLNLPICAMELLAPTLEDIFVKVVGK